MGPAQSVHQKITEYALIAMAVAVPPVSIIANRAIVPVCAVIALTVLLSIGPKRLWNKVVGLNRILLTSAFVFITVLALSTLWTQDAERGFITVAKVLGTFSIATILVLATSTIDIQTAKRVTWAIIGSILVVIAYLGVDFLSDGFFSRSIFNYGGQKYYGFFWHKSSAALLALCIWIPVLMLWRADRAWLAFVLIGIYGALAYSLGANSVTVAVIGGAVFGFLFCMLGRHRAWLTFVAISALIICQPLIIKQFISPAAVSAEMPQGKSISGSTVYRLYIWDFVSDRIFEKPLLGWGVGASRNIGEGELAIDPTRGEIGEAVPLHPHNAFLQLHLEVGILGLLLSLVPIGVILWRLNFPIVSLPERFAGFGLLFATIFQYGVSYSVWSSWWNAAVLFSLAIMVAAWRSRDTDPSAA